MSFGVVATGLTAAGAAKSLFGGGGGSTASKEPWSEVAPWLKNNVKKGEQLQGAYEQQPFNALQQTAYQNAFGDIDNFRANLMPALMQQAAGMLPGFKLPASYGPAAVQGAFNPGLSASGGGGGGAAAPSQFFGQIDWKALNPYANGLIAAQETQTSEQTEEQRRQQEQEDAYQRYLSGERFGGL